jgi:hypothetical protein
MLAASEETLIEIVIVDLNSKEIPLRVRIIHTDIFTRFLTMS